MGMSAPNVPTVTTVMSTVHPSLMSALSSGSEAFEGLCVPADASVAQAIATMLRTGAWMLVVVNDRGTPIGLVFREQFVKEEIVRRHPSGRRRNGATAIRPA